MRPSSFCLKAAIPWTLGILAFVSTTAAHAQSEQTPPSSLAVESPIADVESSLEQARTLMQSLQYEQVIDLLEPLLERMQPDPDQIREVYLLLIEAHVYAGNRCLAGSKEQQLWYEEARRLIRECLGTPEIHTTRLEPPEAYPIEMLQFFDEIRRQIFGSFEITELNPPEAEVYLDGQRLEREEDGNWRELDVPVGMHVIMIRYPGFESLTDDVEIGPATTVRRTYELQRHKGFRWYATRIGLPMTAVGIVVGALVGPSSETPLLPGPPPPPPTGN